jgi:hypothetical protein
MYKHFMYFLPDPPTFGDVLAVMNDMASMGVSRDVVDRVYTVLDEIAKGA